MYKSKTLIKIDTTDHNAVRSMLEKIAVKDDTFRYEINSYNDDVDTVTVYSRTTDEAHQRGTWLINKFNENFTWNDHKYKVEQNGI